MPHSNRNHFESFETYERAFELILTWRKQKQAPHIFWWVRFRSTWKLTVLIKIRIPRCVWVSILCISVMWWLNKFAVDIYFRKTGENKKQSNRMEFYVDRLPANICSPIFCVLCCCCSKCSFHFDAYILLNCICEGKKSMFSSIMKQNLNDYVWNFGCIYLIWSSHWNIDCN